MEILAGALIGALFGFVTIAAIEVYCYKKQYSALIERKGGAANG